MSVKLNLETFLIRKGGVPYDFVVRGKGRMGSGLSESNCDYIIRVVSRHEKLIEALSKNLELSTMSIMQLSMKYAEENGQFNMKKHIESVQKLAKEALVQETPHAQD